MIPDIKQQILIITDPGREEEVITRLARVGYDYCIGYLDGGIEAWKKAGKEVDTIKSISVNEFAEIVKKISRHISLMCVKKVSMILNMWSMRKMPHLIL